MCILTFFCTSVENFLLVCVIDIFSCPPAAFKYCKQRKWMSLRLITFFYVGKKPHWWVLEASVCRGSDRLSPQLSSSGWRRKCHPFLYRGKKKINFIINNYLNGLKTHLWAHTSTCISKYINIEVVTNFSKCLSNIIDLKTN